MSNPETADRTRHYGLIIGDEVEERAFGMVFRGRVIAFDWLDNNRAVIELEDGSKHRAIAEWCHIIKEAAIDGE
jgi:hypothetical protein